MNIFKSSVGINILFIFYRHPIDYHRHNSNKKTRNAMTKAYISKVAIAAFLFCMPKFFESKVVSKTEELEILDPITNLTKTVKSFRS